MAEKGGGALTCGAREAGGILGPTAAAKSGQLRE